MKKIFSLSAFLLMAVSLSAQTADEIIAKHIDAIGGKEKLAAIHSVKMENTMQVMGNDAPSTVWILDGKGYRMEADMMGQKMVQAVNEKGGWAINPMGGSPDPQALTPEQLKGTSSQLFVIPLLDYQKKGFTAELLGKEKAGDGEAWKVKLADKDGGSTTYYFDTKTYYNVIQEKSAEMMGNTITNVITFSDFRKTDAGWVIPYAQEMNMGGQFSMTSKLNKVELNPAIEASAFESKK